MSFLKKLQRVFAHDRASMASKQTAAAASAKEFKRIFSWSGMKTEYTKLLREAKAKNALAKAKRASTNSAVKPSKLAAALVNLESVATDRLAEIAASTKVRESKYAADKAARDAARIATEAARDAKSAAIRETRLASRIKK